MELRQKYQQTDLGTFPSDWQFNTLKELGTFSKGQGVRKDQSQSGDIPCVRYGELYTTHSEYIKNFRSFISRDVAETSKRLKKGDILFAGSGETKEEIGKCAAFLDDKEAYAGGDIVVFSPKEMDSLFLGFLLNSKRIQAQKASRGQGDAVVHISAGQLKEIKIPVPPLKEQTAIATALSDADALIANLEKLIAKKRLIKQGVMQKLLEPKEGWKTVPLTEVCWFQEGPGLRNWQFTKSGMKVINVTNLEDGFLSLDRTDRHISMNEFKRMYTHFEIQEHDIVVASSGNSYGKVAVVRKQDLPLLMNTSVIRFKRIPNRINYNFLLIFLKSTAFKGQIDLLITGGAQPNFGPAHLKKININLPRTIEEQLTISTGLVDIENEIAALQLKLLKIVQAKQGMMQTLLTGKIRLV